MRDLVILVTDRDMEQAVEKVVRRAPDVLRIRSIDFEIYMHPLHDNGCRTASLDVLRPLADKYQHALVLFDHEGSGAEHRSLDDVEAQVLHDLEINGWQDRAQVIAIDPELEIWLWSDSPEVDRVLGWGGHNLPVRTWLATKGFEIQPNGKPTRPKEALHSALREVRKRNSPALFAQIAEKVSLNRCTDRSFVRLRDILRTWFSRPN